eukprot:409995_1
MTAQMGTSAAQKLLTMKKQMTGDAPGFAAFQHKIENTDKSQKGTDKWEFVHWPLKCRGNFVRLVLEECNVDYIDSFGRDLCGEQIQSVYSGSQKPDKTRYFEAMGPPFLRKFNDKNTFISQSIIQTQFVSQQFGLRPKCPIQHAQSGMIVANCVDIFEEIKGAAIKFKMNPNKEIAKKDLIVFVELRLDKWMKIIEKPLKRVYNGINDEFYVFENRITQGDLAIFNILDGTTEWMGDELVNLLIYKKYPLLKKHKNNMLKKSNGIKKLLKRQETQNVLWWPYYGFDMFGIIETGKYLKQKYLAKL